MTCFRYVDEMREVMRQLAKDPARFQALWFAIWSQEHGSFGADSNVAQVLNPLNIQNQGKARCFVLRDFTCKMLQASHSCRILFRILLDTRGTYT